MICKKTHRTGQNDVSFYLCSCLSTQFLYRTVAKATFNVEDSINAIIKNSITLTIKHHHLSYKNKKEYKFSLKYYKD